jgi:hypothetical protein
VRTRVCVCVSFIVFLCTLWLCECVTICHLTAAVEHNATLEFIYWKNDSVQDSRNKSRVYSRIYFGLDLVLLDGSVPVAIMGTPTALITAASRIDTSEQQTSDSVLLHRLPVLHINCQLYKAFSGEELLQTNFEVSRLVDEPIMFMDLPWDDVFEALLSAHYQDSVPVLKLHLEEPFQHDVAVTCHAEHGIYVQADLAYDTIVNRQGLLSSTYAAQPYDTATTVISLKCAVVYVASILPVGSEVYSLWPNWAMYQGMVTSILAEGAQRWFAVTSGRHVGFYRVHRHYQVTRFRMDDSPMRSTEIMSPDFFQSKGILPGSSVRNRLQGGDFAVERRAQVDAIANIRTQCAID